MTPTEYVAHVNRLDATRIDPYFRRMHHALLGLMSEGGEIADAVKKHVIYGADLDLVNVAEEIGDLYWYLALMVDAMEADAEEIFEYVIGPEEQEQAKDLEISTVLASCSYKFGTIAQSIFTHLDEVATHEYPEIDGNGVGALMEVAAWNLSAMAFVIGKTPQEIREANIAKLRKRFPEKFTSEAALNRDLSSERNVLESSLSH